MKYVNYIGVLVLVFLAVSFSANYTGYATNSNNATGTVSFNFIFSILEQTIYNIGSTSAQINFTSNFKSNGTVYYGIVNLTSNVSDNLSSFDHSLNLTSLTPSTTYNYSLLAYSYFGNATLGPFSFTTLPGIADTEKPVFNYILPSVSNNSAYVDTEYNFTLNITDNDLIDNVTLNYGTGQIILNGSNDIYTYTLPNFISGIYYLNFTATDRTGNQNTLNYTYQINKAEPVINTSSNSISYYENETNVLEIITSTNNYTIEVINNSISILSLGNFTNNINLTLNSSSLAYLGNLSLPVGNYILNITSFETDNYLKKSKLVSINVYALSQTLISFDNLNNPYEYTQEGINVTSNTQGPAIASLGLNDTRFTYNGTILNSTILDVGTYSVLVSINNTLAVSSQAILVIEVTDTLAPTIGTPVLSPNTSYYIDDQRSLLVNITDASTFNATININSQTINYINNSFDLNSLGAGTYYYTITATDIYGNTATYNNNITITQNNIYEFEFKLNDVSADAYSIKPSTNYNIYAQIPNYNKTFDVILKNTDTGNTTVLATDVYEYNTSTFLISSTGNYEIQLVSSSNTNFTALTETISLTVSSPVTPPSTGGGSTGGGGGGGGSSIGGGGSTGEPTPSCVSAFACNDWSECTECDDCEENKGNQNRVCTPIVDCNDNQKPKELRSCDLIPKRNPVKHSKGVCKELYDCTEWSECLDGERTRQCTQTTSCEPDYVPELTTSCDDYASYDDILDKRIINFGALRSSQVKSEYVLDGDIILFEFAGESYQIHVDDSGDLALVTQFLNTGSEMIIKDGNEYFLDLDGDGAVDVEISYMVGERGRFYIRDVTSSFRVQTPQPVEPEFKTIEVAKRSINLIVASLVILLLLITFALTKDYVYEYVSDTKQLIGKKNGKSKKQFRKR